MALPPEDPTRPLRPPGTLPPPMRERAALADDEAWRQVVLDRLDGLRTGLVLVGVLAVLALALAAWTFLRERQDRTGSRRGGVSSAEVETIRSQVRELESRLGNRATKSQVSAIQTSEQDLAQRVDDLAGKATAKPAPASTTDTEARQSLDRLDGTVSTLDQSVKDLDGRVQSLEDQAQQSP